MIERNTDINKTNCIHAIDVSIAINHVIKRTHIGMDLVITTGVWERIQEKALEILNDQSVHIDDNTIEYLNLITFGVIPYNLRIVKPDPMTNIR